MQARVPLLARILYLHRDPSWAGFIVDDLRILQARHQVEDVRFEYGVGPTASLLSRVRVCDLVYFWWGDITGALGASMARALGKPSIMITGGYDVAWVPEIRYGLRGKPLRRHLVPWSLRIATRIVANADVMRRVVMEDYGVAPDKVVAIPHGVEASEIAAGPARRDRLALTCGQVGEASIRRKGIDTFVAAARHLPDVKFVVIGKLGDDAAARRLFADKPSNVELTGFVTREALIDTMQRASVIVQVSAHEGFGVALAEAMLAGATPVVTDRGALREVVGDTGRYVPYGDARATADAIAATIAAPRSVEARARIETAFPLSVRRDRILALVDEVLEARAC